MTRSREACIQAQGLGAAEARLFYSLASIAASQVLAEDALKQCLDIVCDYVGWPVGHIYIVASDGTGELAPTTIWHLDFPERFEVFRALTERTRFATGVGLPGRVLSSGNPAWVPDVQDDDNFPRNKLARDIGVRGAFAFPVKIGVKLVAVLEFFTQKRMELDDHVLEIMRMVGTQVGRILERERTDQALRKASDDLENRVQDRTVELETLVSIARILATADAYPNRVGDVMKAAMNAVNADYAVLRVNDEKQGILSKVGYAVRPPLASFEVPEQLPYDDSPTSVAAQTGEIQILGNRSSFTFKSVRPLVMASESFAAIPIKDPTQTKVIGVMGVLSVERNHFSNAHIKLLSGLADFLGVVMENVQLMDKIRDTEEHLIQADKLAAIGTLVSGVAHEVNNPLTGVLIQTQLLLRKDIDEATKQSLSLIQAETYRAAKIVQNLLSFSRQGIPQRQSANINEILGKVIELRAYEFRIHNIEVVNESRPEIPNTMVDVGQIQQVFLNLVNNAEQAMLESNGRGQIRVRTSYKDGSIRVSIADNGPGIPSDILNRIFDPFFTTKEPGKGTGLGLSICHGIIQEHGGEIRVETQIGEGTTFIVELPVIQQPSDAMTDAQTDKRR